MELFTEILTSAITIITEKLIIYQYLILIKLKEGFINGI
jgi:hypothetical protein